VKETKLKRAAGLWLDHRKAMIVLLSASGEDSKLIIAHVERQPRRSVSSHIKGHGDRPCSGCNTQADDIQQRKYTGALNIYYDAVIAGIGDANAIFIFGPGEAKGELRKRVQKKGSLLTGSWASKQRTR